jgi:hypothetical protein
VWPSDKCEVILLPNSMVIAAGGPGFLFQSVDALKDTCRDDLSVKDQNKWSNKGLISSSHLGRD